MKKKYTPYFICFVFLVSGILNAVTTETHSNARSLFEKEKKSLKNVALIGTFLPVPILSTIFQAPHLWSEYNKCKKIYNYLVYSHIHINRNDFSKNKKNKADKNLQLLLEKIKEESLAARKNPTSIFTPSEGQKKLDARIDTMTISDLANLINKADKVIPDVLGDARFHTANYDLFNFR